MSAHSLRSHAEVLKVRPNLNSHTYRQLAMPSPTIPVRQHCLITLFSLHENPWDLEGRSTGIDIRTFIHQIACSPSIVEDDRGGAAKPYGNNGTLIIVGPFFEAVPWFAFRKLEDVANDWERDRPRGHLGSQAENAGIVDEYTEDNEGQRGEEDLSGMERLEIFVESHLESGWGGRRGSGAFIAIACPDPGSGDPTI